MLQDCNTVGRWYPQKIHSRTSYGYWGQESPPGSPGPSGCDRKHQIDEGQLCSGTNIVTDESCRGRWALGGLFKIRETFQRRVLGFNGSIWINLFYHQEPFFPILPGPDLHSSPSSLLPIPPTPAAFHYLFQTPMWPYLWRQASLVQCCTDPATHHFQWQLGHTLQHCRICDSQKAHFTARMHFQVTQPLDRIGLLILWASA